MRIIFIGTVGFSRHCLEQVLERGGEVVGIFTLPREKAGFNTDYADLGPIAARENIPVFRIHRINEEHNIQAIRSLRPDVIFVFGFSQIISKKILDIPSLGCIGTHPALLPRNRGRHPLVWALIEDLSQSGLTFFVLDEGADSGDIVWQKPFFITDDDDAGTLYGKVMDLADEGISAILTMLKGGGITRSAQDDSKATYWRKRTEKDGEIQWTGTARQAWNLTRALTRPYVGAHTFAGDTRLILWRVSVCMDQTGLPASEKAQPGDVVSITTKGPLVRTADGLVRIEEWENPSGVILAPGTKLGRKTP